MGAEDVNTDGDVSTDSETDTTDAAQSSDVEKYKALARKNEARAKANAEAARELPALKAQLEKLAPLAKIAEMFGDKNDKSGTDSSDAIIKRISDMEDSLRKANAARDRAEIAAEHGLTARQAKRLVGATREELEADAKELLQDIKASGEETKGTKATMRKDEGQGSRGTNSAQAARDAARAEAKRRFPDQK
jgi:hypothetical protein